VTAVGSGGTMAGLVAVLGPERVLGVDCGAVSDPAGAVARLLTGLTAAPFDPMVLRIRRDQVGDGYGALTEHVLDALTAAARTEGVVLDPIYTGRALAGLTAAVAEGEVRPGDRTVFLHSGGLPGLFGHAATVARATALLRD
jgi:D-cysteine desulfhydrase